MKIGELPGLEPQHALVLHASGIQSCRHLLRAYSRQDTLQDLRTRTGLPEEVLHEIAGRAALSQVHGIGPANLAYMVAVGVTSVADLASEEPASLRERLRPAAPHTPNLAVIEHWILQARRTRKVWT